MEREKQKKKPDQNVEEKHSTQGLEVAPSNQLLQTDNNTATED